MYTALVAIQLVLAIGIIGLVLMQHGKGADAGAAFGSGASGTVFGSLGSANFLSRSTGILAALFMLTSLALAVIVARGSSGQESVLDRVELPAAPAPIRAAPEDLAPEAAAEPELQAQPAVEAPAEDAAATEGAPE